MTELVRSGNTRETTISIENQVPSTAYLDCDREFSHGEASSAAASDGVPATPAETLKQSGSQRLQGRLISTVTRRFGSDSDISPGRFALLGAVFCVIRWIGAFFTWAALMAGSHVAVTRGLLSAGNAARTAARGSILYGVFVGLFYLGSGLWLSVRKRAAA